MAVSTHALTDYEWREINAGATHVLLQVRSGGAVLVQLVDAEPDPDSDVGIILSNDFEPKIAISDIPLGSSIWAKSMGGTYQRVDTIWS